VFVADDRERSADHSPDGERDVRADDAELEELREELAATRIAMARLEERLVAAERRDTDLQASLELEHSRADAALAAERACADHLAAELADARKGWLERLIEAVRKR
jgi:septal ring factor EnvC (AmiA/AmiB activator)